MSTTFSEPASDTIIDAARAGDPAAREALYRLYAVPVFTLARRMIGETAGAEDVLQDCFIDVFDKLADWRADAPLGLWIRRIVINRCLMHRRTAWQSRREPLETGGEAAADDDPATGRDLQTLLDRLPPEDRQVLWLKEVEGFSHAEIAEMQGRSVSYSKSRLARAYEQLKQQLADEVSPCTQRQAN